jgi:hypothetical protein
MMTTAEKKPAKAAPPTKYARKFKMGISRRRKAICHIDIRCIHHPSLVIDALP